MSLPVSPLPPVDPPGAASSLKNRPRAALFGDSGVAGETIQGVYGAERLREIGRITELYPRQVTSENLEECLPELADLEVIFATWGMLRLTEAHLERLPRLRAVFYAGGSVTPFAHPLLGRGIAVVSAWAANAVPVAEFTLAQILLANKGYFRNLREYRQTSDYQHAFRGSGNYDTTVSVLGAGQIGRKVIELLRPFHLAPLIFDPFLSAEEAGVLGAEKVGLAEAFARGKVVSNHLADVPDTVGMLHGGLFSSMPVDGAFINTGRGRTVDHAGLLAVLGERPDLTALLDVTDPEPLPADSLLWTARNAWISSHMAGSIGREVTRMADLVIAEFGRWSRGEPMLHSITLEALRRLA